MSKQQLKDSFSKLCQCQAWSLQLLQIKNSVRNGTTYISREIEIAPETKAFEYLRALSEYYCSDKGIDAYSSVDAYTGDVVNHVIYKLSREDSLIKDACARLMTKIADPDRETPIMSIKPNALILKGSVSSGAADAPDIPVVLVFMRNPITVLSNKYALGINGKFREIQEPVLALRKTLDVAIIGDHIYLFTLNGEALFNMEKTYKAICKTQAEEISQCGFLTDAETFKMVADQGRNPRRFVAYNPAHFEALKDVERRSQLAAKFDLPMSGEQLVTHDAKAVERLIKFLCDKAMLDPCDESPVEVYATKPWAR